MLHKLNLYPYNLLWQTGKEPQYGTWHQFKHPNVLPFSKCPHLLLNIHRAAFKVWNMSQYSAVGASSLSLLSLSTVHLESDPVQSCPNHCPTTTGGNRFRYEAWLVSRTLPTLSRTSIGTSISPWSRTEMWPLRGITTLLWPTQCGTTWSADGSEPSSTTMRKTPKWVTSMSPTQGLD